VTNWEGSAALLRPLIFWDVTWPRFLVDYRRFGKHRLHLQGSSSPRRMNCLNLEDGIDLFSRNVKEPATNCQPASHNIEEDRKPRLHCDVSPKSRVFIVTWNNMAVSVLDGLNGWSVSGSWVWADARTRDVLNTKHRNIQFRTVVQSAFFPLRTSRVYLVRVYMRKVGLCSSRNRFKWKIIWVCDRCLW
jgi:hypothetical protein